MVTQDLWIHFLALQLHPSSVNPLMLKHIHIRALYQHILQALMTCLHLTISGYRSLVNFTSDTNSVFGFVFFFFSTTYCSNSSIRKVLWKPVLVRLPILSSGVPVCLAQVSGLISLVGKVFNCSLPPDKNHFYVIIIQSSNL